MGVTEQILSGIKSGREAFALRMDEYRTASGGGQTEPVSPEETKSQLALGDNVDFMTDLLKEGYAGRFRLIYADPPFFTRSKFNAAVSVTDSAGSKHRIRHLAFDDRFERDLACYIENLTVRILLMKELLAEDGLLWIHLDWHSSHYVKLVLDELMGEKNFVNEIVWCYKSGGSGKRHFSRKHDTILVYSRSRKYYIDIPEEKSYNRGFKPYNFKGVREFCDERGWYTLVNMKDIWNVDMVGRTSAERTGYATQKPLELMRRIIEASTEKGDLTGDFFCGSGSLLEAAEMLGRKWIGCDNEKLAFSMARKRMFRRGADFVCRYPAHDQPEGGRADIRVTGTEPLESGRTLYRCVVSDFVPDIDTGYIQVNDRGYVEEAVRNDPLQLIDYLIVRGTERGEKDDLTVVESGFDDMTFICSGKPEITVADVFGKEYDAELVF